jgi:hypothetical protein
MNNLLIIIFVIILIFLLKPCKTTINNNFEKYNNLLNINYIKDFTKNNSIYRPVPSENLERVKLNVLNELSKIPNFIIKEQFFTRIINNKEYNFSNIIANSSKFDDTKPYIILSAHVDGPVMNNCPASIDAITSIGIIIELTKKLLENYNNYNLQIVFFDGEEAIDGNWSNKNTLSGSSFFVKQIKNKPVQVFVFDLIGGDIATNKLYGYSNNPKSHLLMSKLTWTNNSLYPENEKIFIDPNETISYNIITDDAYPFLKANIPVIDLIPATFPKVHHTINDNFENVNWKYIEIFINVIFNYLVKNPVLN